MSVSHLLSSSEEVVKSCDNAKARNFKNDRVRKKHVSKGFGLRSWLEQVRLFSVNFRIGLSECYALSFPHFCILYLSHVI